MDAGDAYYEGRIEMATEIIAMIDHDIAVLDRYPNQSSYIAGRRKGLENLRRAVDAERPAPPSE